MTTRERGRRIDTVLSLPAYAKVNLSLEILGRRPDGFHEIVSVTQLISLADTVEATIADTTSVEMTPAVIDEAENLVGSAARAFAAETGQDARAAIRIQKRIPLAAGLGGGSSDAAAALRLLDRLHGTQLPPQRLGEIASTLGSDVPLFLSGGTNLIRGRGDIVKQLPPVPTFWLLLICPGGAPTEKTRALYGALSPAEYGTGAVTLTLVDGIMAGMSMVGADLVNGFDSAASRVYVGFDELRQKLQESIGRPVHLTGAGPTLFATFADATQARSAARQVASLGLSAFVARSIERRASIRGRIASTAPS